MDQQETEDRSVTNWPGRWERVRSPLRDTLQTVVLTLLIYFSIRAFLVENFRVVGYSMEPTLHEGQYLIINKLAYRFRPPQRGDIVVFEYPKAPRRDFIKRVIGLPGEEVAIKGEHVYINGKPLDEPYLSNHVNYSWGPAVIGEDEYFVLGDNRNNSSDSHSWGMLPRKNIIGKAWLSYWPPQEWGIVPHYTFISE